VHTVAASGATTAGGAHGLADTGSDLLGTLGAAALALLAGLGALLFGRRRTLRG
jgi:LPXTG-motif cell wall-anchored protein